MCSRICSSRQKVDQEHQLHKTLRATRIFCSNRHQATGCGRTFSVWMADKIRRLLLSADSLWAFLTQTAASDNQLAAFRKKPKNSKKQQTVKKAADSQKSSRQSRSGDQARGKQHRMSGGNWRGARRPEQETMVRT